MDFVFIFLEENAHMNDDRFNDVIHKMGYFWPH